MMDTESGCDLTPLHWLHNINIMSQCGFEEKANSKNKKNEVVDLTDYRTTNKKPPLSYSSLIVKAIKASENNKSTLSQIYSWIKENYLYYSTAEPSWQNSIRHNLSLNKCFVKIPRAKNEAGKGGFWSLDETLIGRSGSKRKKKRKKSNAPTAPLPSPIPPPPPQLQQLQQQPSIAITLVDCNNQIIQLPTQDLPTIVLNNCVEPEQDETETMTMMSVGICQDDTMIFTGHEEIVKSETIESELILENVYWPFAEGMETQHLQQFQCLDLDHLISIGEL